MLPICYIDGRPDGIVAGCGQVEIYSFLSLTYCEEYTHTVQYTHLQIVCSAPDCDWLERQLCNQ